MSKQREAFEAYWIGKWAGALSTLPGAMAGAFKEMAEHAWQASRAAALESVEALLEDKRREAWGQTEVEWAFGDALETVSALKEQS